MAEKPELLSIGKMLLASHKKQLEQDFTVYYMPDMLPPLERAAAMKDYAQRLRYLQTSGSLGADATLINSLPKLELISCFAVGVDKVDLAAAKARGIRVTNTPDVLNNCVADLAIGLMIAASRRIAEADAYTRSGKWAYDGSFGLSSRVTGKRLGIIGLGNIGKAIAKRAAAFDMPIAYHGRNKQKDVAYAYYADPAEMAANSDIVIVICPGGEATRNIAGEKVIRALGPKGLLVNVSRGSTVDEAALVKALKEGALGGAALDVLAKEPAPAHELFSMPNVVVVPHMASATFETRTDMGNLVVENLRAHLQGKPLLTPVV